MLVYKYRNCGQRTWELLLNRKLFFATPEQLNDPLDSSIDIQREYEKAKEAVVELDDHPERRKSFLLFLLNEHPFKDPETGKKIGLNKALQRFIQSLGILSLSKTPADALLWSHYAEGHSGVALGFETKHLGLKDIFIKGEVKYAVAPPYIDLFLKMAEELGDFVRPWDNQKYPDEQGDRFYTSQLSRLMHANLLVKSEKWKYEEEYRMITTKPGLHEFPAKALREVILGTKTKESDLETLSNILTHPDYEHVKVRRVANVAGTFEFGFVSSRGKRSKKQDNSQIASLRAAVKS